MRVIVRPRQAGKTKMAVEWVLGGNATPVYPFWDRVLLVQSIAEAERVRREWPELDYTQVYSWQEWANRARLGSRVINVQVAVDNADTLLSEVLGGLPSMITTGGLAE